MIIYNPQDLTPLLTAMREGLQADMNALTANVQTANDALSQSVSTEIDALTVVNGEIKTDVQAINAHTDEAINNIVPRRSYFKALTFSNSTLSIGGRTPSGPFTLLDIQGSGYLYKLDEYNSYNKEFTEIEVDGVAVGRAEFLEAFAVNGRVSFDTSIKLVITHTYYSSSSVVTPSVDYCLGVWEWK